MIIKFWGTRGSIPVSGKEFVKYGGDTTCVEIRTENDEIIIVDAGTGIRKLGKQLLSEERFSYHMIFTHAHWDHLLGFPFFRPIYRKETDISLYGCPFAQQSVKDMISKTMLPPYFPVYYDSIQAEIKYHGACKCLFHIDTVSITPISLSHPNRANGYKFVENDRSFVFMTDNELSHIHPGGLNFLEYVNFAEQADLLVHDAEFTYEEYALTKTWGHSVYLDALKLAVEARVKNFGLFHHNQDRTDKALESLEHECRKIISNEGLNMNCFAVFDGMEYILR